jgi:hypothetical protein
MTAVLRVPRQPSDRRLRIDVFGVDENGIVTRR